MEWLEVAAPSIETAKEIALDRLGVHESDAELKIVSEGKIGLLGRVKEEARIRARVLPTEVRPKDRKGRRGRRSRTSSQSAKSGASRSGTRSAKQQRSRPKVGKLKPQKAVGRESRRGSGRRHSTVGGDSTGGASVKTRAVANTGAKERKRKRRDYSPLSLEEQADLAESFVQGVAKAVGVKLNFTRYGPDDGILRIKATGDDIGVLVGRRGTTARAIDGLVRTVLQRSGGTTRDGKIRMDIGGLKARRDSAIADFAKTAASEVVESGEGVRLDPMSRLERKIVHDAVAEIKGVGSYSEGSDPTRYVVLGVAAGSADSADYSESPD